MRFFPICTLSVCVFVLTLAPAGMFAQCSNGQPAKMMSYDTSVIGGGNDDYIFTFPQFNPSLGTSVSVLVDTYVSLEYTFQLENNNAAGSVHTIRVSRTDDILYPSGSLTATNRQNLGPYLLAGSDGVPGSGEDFVMDGPLLVFRGLHNIYPITNNVVPFLGNSTVDINYSTSSFANVMGNLNSTLRGEAIDTILFRLSYNYCALAALPSTINNFTARQEGSGNVRIKWYSPNDYIGKKFDVEKSVDGRNFTPVHEVIANSNNGTTYDFVYKPAAADKNKVFFRIKEYDAEGTFSYSAIRDLSLPYTESTMKVYPTMPTNRLQVFFPLANKSDYTVSIISMTGQVMQKSDFNRTNFFKLDFKRPLPKGTYVVYAVNKQTLEAQHSKILVQ